MIKDALLVIGILSVMVGLWFIYKPLVGVMPGLFLIWLALAKSR